VSQTRKENRKYAENRIAGKHFLEF